MISQASCQYYIYTRVYTCANDCTFLYQQLYFLPSIKCNPERNKDLVSLPYSSCRQVQSRNFEGRILEEGLHLLNLLIQINLD